MEVETLEGIADRGYGNEDEILNCLLNGDTPTTHPNKGEKCRVFRFQKTQTEVTEEMLASTDKETLLQCITAGVLPQILQRDDVELEVMRRREQGSSLYLDKETGEFVPYAEMKAMGGLERAAVEVKREPPLQPYFERDIEKDIVICPMVRHCFTQVRDSQAVRKTLQFADTTDFQRVPNVLTNVHLDNREWYHSKKVKPEKRKVFMTGHVIIKFFAK